MVEDTQIFFTTVEEFVVCRQLVIDYGRDLKAALVDADVMFNDLCTPTL